MMQSIRYAGQRLSRLMALSFMIAGMVGVLILTMPVIELNIAPPVREWRIVDAVRVGDELRWYVFVDKRRNCISTVRWSAQWGNEYSPLKAIWPDGTISGNSRLRLPSMTVGTFGPLTAMIPRGWQGADGIWISAHVVYDCGTPWDLPPVPVAPVMVR